MKKRLRRKLHKNEFREMGFEVMINFKPTLERQDLQRLQDVFLQMVETNGLEMGGGLDYHSEVFVVVFNGSAELTS
jgi:uncharacterized protein YggL (DUF469 family)